MGSRRIRPLTAADLPGLPDPCPRCTFWETSPADLAAPDEHHDRAGTKSEWARAVTDRWGYCGVLMVDDGRTLAHLTMAPAGLVPRLGTFATTPVSPDAAVVMSVRVVEELRGHGLGRQLIQAAAALVLRRDIRAMEAVGTMAPGPSCMIPAGFLEAVGFSVVRPHPSTPRLRLNLQSTVRWMPDLGAAWTRLTDLVSQPAAPQPGGVGFRTPTPSA